MFWLVEALLTELQGPRLGGSGGGGRAALEGAAGLAECLGGGKASGGSTQNIPKSHGKHEVPEVFDVFMMFDVTSVSWMFRKPRGNVLLGWWFKIL